MATKMFVDVPFIGVAPKFIHLAAQGAIPPEHYRLNFAGTRAILEMDVTDATRIIINADPNSHELTTAEARTLTEAYDTEFPDRY